MPIFPVCTTVSRPSSGQPSARRAAAGVRSVRPTWEKSGTSIMRSASTPPEIKAGLNFVVITPTRPARQALDTQSRRHATADNEEPR